MLWFFQKLNSITHEVLRKQHREIGMQDICVQMKSFPSKWTQEFQVLR